AASARAPTRCNATSSPAISSVQGCARAVSPLARCPTRAREEPPIGPEPHRLLGGRRRRLPRDTQCDLEPGDLLAERLHLQPASDHLHLDAADLHRRLGAATRLWIAPGIVLDVENPLLVLPVGLLRLAQALPRLCQRYHVGGLLRIGFLLEL